MSVTTQSMFELLFVRDCMKRRAFEVLANAADASLTMDDVLAGGSTLHTHTHVEDAVSTVEDMTPGQPPGMVHTSGTTHVH